MEVSSLSWSTQTRQCYNCISSWYSTFFNITSLQFLSGGGPRAAFHRGVLLGSAALWLLAFLFTTGKSYSHHLLAVCHCSPSYQPVTTRTATELQAYCSQRCFAVREMALERQAAALVFQLNSCSAGDSLNSPRATLPPEALRLLSTMA